MAAIGKRTRGNADQIGMAGNGAAIPSHERAIERLREIAEHGMDDRALGEFGDNNDVKEPQPGQEPVAVPTEELASAQMRIVEALLFAAPQPLSEKKIAEYLPHETDVRALIQRIEGKYAGGGVQLVRVAGKWTFRTADDLSYLLENYAVEERRLSKAALETLAIIAYHQPVTRAEIEEIRGVQTSRGTLDVLMETAWIRPRGRRRAPGKPLTYGTTESFLTHFGLDSLGDLPGLGELKGAGLLSSDLPPDLVVPSPRDVAALMPDELPLEDDDEGEAPELEFDADVDDSADEHADTDEPVHAPGRSFEGNVTPGDT